MLDKRAGAIARLMENSRADLGERRSALRDSGGVRNFCKRANCDAQAILFRAGMIHKKRLFHSDVPDRRAVKEYRFCADSGFQRTGRIARRREKRENGHASGKRWVMNARSRRTGFVVGSP